MLDEISKMVTLHFAFVRVGKSHNDDGFSSSHRHRFMAFEQQAVIISSDFMFCQEQRLNSEIL